MVCVILAFLAGWFGGFGWFGCFALCSSGWRIAADFGVVASLDFLGCCGGFCLWFSFCVGLV